LKWEEEREGGSGGRRALQFDTRESAKDRTFLRDTGEGMGEGGAAPQTT
jgi:hypothetical protein